MSASYTAEDIIGTEKAKMVNGHKNGINPVKYVDESEAEIIDPKSCDRGRYNYFVGYFRISRKN